MYEVASLWPSIWAIDIGMRLIDRLCTSIDASEWELISLLMGAFLKTLTPKIKCHRTWNRISLCRNNDFSFLFLSKRLWHIEMGARRCLANHFPGRHDKWINIIYYIWIWNGIISNTVYFCSQTISYKLKS